MAATDSRTPLARANLRDYADAYVENDLLTYASAISFQILSSIVPFRCSASALLGFLHLEGVWRDELAPRVEPTRLARGASRCRRRRSSTALSSQQLFWLTAGFALALWQVSGAIRAVMGALNRSTALRPAVVAAADARLDRAGARGGRVLAGGDRAW